MAKVKDVLLKDFLGEMVSILTPAKSMVETSSGELAEIPLAYEGVLADYDDMFVLITNDPTGPPELVAIEKIISIRVMDESILDLVSSDKPGPEGYN